MIFPQKRILFLSHRYPWPLIGGDRVKAYHLLQYLSTIAEVDLIALDEAGTSEMALAHRAELPCRDIKVIPFRKGEAMQKIAAGLFTGRSIEFSYYDSSAMKAAVRQSLAVKKYDLIISFFSRTAQNIPSECSIPKILIAEDARVLLQERATVNFEFSPEYLIRRIDRKRLRTEETDTMRRFDLVTFVAKSDEAKIVSLCEDLRTAILSNGVDLKAFPVSEHGRNKRLIFTGHLGIYHNKLMAEDLVRSIFPKIRELEPQAELYIVGKNPDAMLQRLCQETAGVMLMANVPHIQHYLDAGSIFLHPQWIGAGIQNKVLEAMAVGLPVITTSVGKSGIVGFESGCHGLVASSNSELAELAVDLLRNPAKGRQMAVEARKLIEKEHSWAKIYRDFGRLLQPFGFRDLAALSAKLSEKEQMAEGSEDNDREKFTL